MIKKFSGKKILVTGADGFIGSHLTDALVGHGCDVRAFVLYNSFNSFGWLDHTPRSGLNLEVVAGDIRDPGFVRKAVEGCDIILHLAALIAIPYSYVAPDSYVNTNVLGTLNILNAAKDAKAQRVICTSTSEVYGTARYVPIDEQHPLQAQSPYAASKIAADQMSLSFHRSFGLPVMLVRPFNTYGPRQSARAVIPSIIMQIASGAKEIKLGSLHPTRDFCFVQDTVSGFISAAACDVVGDVVNVGAGFELSIGELATIIADTMGVNVSIVESAERVRPMESEVDRLFCGIQKANDLMGWSPSFGGIDGFKRGIKETIDWFTIPANLSLYKPREYNV